MKRFVNISNAVREYIKANPDAAAAVPSIGYKIQMSRAGLVHTMSAEDIEILHGLATHLRQVAGE